MGRDQRQALLRSVEQTAPKGKQAGPFAACAKGSYSATRRRGAVTATIWVSSPRI